MDWSTNPIKLARAKGNLSPNATEEHIKEEYIRLGGFVKGEPITVTADEKPVSKEVVIPKKKAKKKVTKKK